MDFPQLFHLGRHEATHIGLEKRPQRNKAGHKINRLFLTFIYLRVEEYAAVVIFNVLKATRKKMKKKVEVRWKERRGKHKLLPLYNASNI